MAKLPRNYRISREVDELLKSEAARLSEAHGQKVSEADVIELAMVKWCNGEDVVIETAPPAKRQSKRDQAIASRAASDLTAQEVGRDNIDYSDVDSTPTTHVATLDAVSPSPLTGRGKLTMENWRANRKPLTKPKEQKETK